MAEGEVRRSPLPRRLREARTAIGISQRQLGVLAGIDAFAASARVNQYEQGKHAPDFGTAVRLAAVLGVPVPYLFAEDDDLAVVIRAFGTAPGERRKRLIQLLAEREPIGSGSD